MAVISVVDLTPRQKAAIVVMTLGPGSRDLLKELGGGEVELLAEEILQLGTVPQGMRDEVLTEFCNRLSARQTTDASGLEKAAEVLEASLGKAEAGQVVKRIEWRANRNLRNFARRDPGAFATLVADEHPQTIAFLLTQLEPDVSGRVLSALGDDMRPEVAWRIATMGDLLPQTAARVHGALASKVAPKKAASERTERLGGESKVADLLNMVSMESQKRVLETLASRSADVAERVRKLMFVFRDLLLLDDRAMQRVLKEVDLKDLSLALKTADKDVKEKIFKNVSERAALTIQEEMDYMGPVKAADVAQAQDRIIEHVRALEEQGEIVVNRGGSEDDALV
jgi:flagellar motor switch protein FliG